MKRLRPASVSGRGFTLVELLVVSSIIVILAALTVPLVGRGLSNAHRMRCSSNLSQLARSVFLYADHNPRNPRQYLPPFPTLASDSDWVRAVTNFVADVNMREVLTCPARKLNRASLCYSGHPRLLGTTRGYRASDVPRTSAVILIGEGPQASGGGDAAKLYTAWDAAAGSAQSQADTPLPDHGADGVGGIVAWRHRVEGRPAANFAFADSHVETIPTNTLRYQNVAIGY
mgnify:CR=1 FL=1